MQNELNAPAIDVIFKELSTDLPGDDEDEDDEDDDDDEVVEGRPGSGD